MTKKEWNRYLQAENNYWLDIGLQIKKEPCAYKTLEIFLVVLSLFFRFILCIFRLIHKP